jgi:hypothetical protein
MSFLCWLIVSALTLGWSEEPAPKTAEASAAERSLTKPICCSFKDVSLQEACSWFEYLMSVRINIDPDAMKQARSEEGRHVTLEAENMPFEEVLEKMLKPIGLTYDANEEGIHITTETAVETGPEPEQIDEEMPYSEEEPGEHSVEDPAKIKRVDLSVYEEEGSYHKDLSDEKPASSTQEIEKRLTTSMSVRFQNTPLAMVCRDLQYLTGINIVLDKEALKEASIGLDQPLSLTAENVSAKSVLNLLLKQVNLTYQIKDNVLWITTEPQCHGGRIQDVTYPVAKYLENGCEKELINWITWTIAPETWEAQGGPGKIAFCPKEKTLVVSQQTQDVHEQIAELLHRFGAERSVDPWNIERNLVEEIEKAKVCQVVYPVGDLVMPADEITPVVCKVLDKPCKLLANEAHHTLEGYLIELITTKIAPESWESAGGSGRIQFFPLAMSLVVRNTKEVQKQVADLLANLRKLQKIQDKEYALEMRLVEERDDGKRKETPLPRVTMMQGRWFTMFQGKTVTLKDGSIQDLLASALQKEPAAPKKASAVLLQGSWPQTRTLELTDDDVPVGLVIRGKVTTLDSKNVRLDLIIQKNELDSASRDSIEVVGSSLRSAQRIAIGKSPERNGKLTGELWFNHVLEEDDDGAPLVWLEVRVLAVQPDVTNTFDERIFRGIEEPIPRP